MNKKMKISQIQKKYPKMGPKYLEYPCMNVQKIWNEILNNNNLVS